MLDNVIETKQAFDQVGSLDQESLRVLADTAVSKLLLADGSAMQTQLLMLLLSIVQHGYTENKQSLINVASRHGLDTNWSNTESQAVANQILEHLAPTDVDIDAQLVDIKKMLLKLPRPNVSAAGYKTLKPIRNALRPQLGYSAVEEDTRLKWKTSGDVQSVAMLASLLPFMNLDHYWYIIAPAILNLFDDTDIEIRLMGVQLLSKLCTAGGGKQILKSGLYNELLTPMNNMLRLSPPLNTVENCLHIQEHVYPVILTLIRSCHEDPRQELSKVTADVIQSVSRSKDHHQILLLTMKQLIILTQEIGTYTVLHLQRLIFVIGTLVANPFIVAYMPLLESIITLLNNVVDICIARIPNHKYDLLGIACLVYRKLDCEENIKFDLKRLVAKLQVSEQEKERITNNSTYTGLFQ